METVADLMTPEPVIVRQDTSLAECAHLLALHHIRHLPVVDAAGAIAGVVYDHDVFARGSFTGDDRDVWITLVHDRGHTAAEVAREAQTVAGRDDDLLPRIADALDRRDDIIVVVDDVRHPCGVITEHDLVRLAQDLIPPDVPARRESTAPVRRIAHDRSVREAWEAMLDGGIRHLVVTDRDRAVGVLSWRDLVVSDAARSDVRLSEVVPSPLLVTLPVETTLRHAARTMVTRAIGCVPLVDAGGALRAIVTRTDVVRAMIAAVEQDQLFGG